MKCLIGVVTPPCDQATSALVAAVERLVPHGSRVYDASALWARLRETTDELAKAHARIAVLEEELARSSHHG